MFIEVIILSIFLVICSRTVIIFISKWKIKKINDLNYSIEKMNVLVEECYKVMDTILPKGYVKRKRFDVVTFVIVLSSTMIIFYPHNFIVVGLLSLTLLFYVTIIIISCNKFKKSSGEDKYKDVVLSIIIHESIMINKHTDLKVEDKLAFVFMGFVVDYNGNIYKDKNKYNLNEIDEIKIKRGLFFFIKFNLMGSNINWNSEYYLDTTINNFYLYSNDGAYKFIDMRDDLLKYKVIKPKDYLSENYKSKKD